MLVAVAFPCAYEVCVFFCGWFSKAALACVCTECAEFFEEGLLCFHFVSFPVADFVFEFEIVLV